MTSLFSAFLSESNSPTGTQSDISNQELSLRIIRQHLKGRMAVAIHSPEALYQLQF
ncbi:MAG: hypothetical protein RBT40_07760 [Petrimonas sp.]|uniref:hypothetical protein n=1 Tax=Petrimonas sp. TaxID=2023866 RepID=UPI002A4A2CB2|nr:hypothetical protein [Petrimonas sp.]